MAYILNSFGVMHTIPDDMALPAGARKATPAEVAAWLIADDTAKAAILAAKQAAAARRAQLVVVSAPVAEPASPSAFSRLPQEHEKPHEKPRAGDTRKSV